MNEKMKLFEKISGFNGVIFKIVIVIILIVFLYLYYLNTENDRYKFINREGAARVEILDSRSGDVYRFIVAGPASHYWLKYSQFKDVTRVDVTERESPVTGTSGFQDDLGLAGKTPKDKPASQ